MRQNIIYTALIYQLRRIHVLIIFMNSAQDYSANKQCYNDSQTMFINSTPNLDPRVYACTMCTLRKWELLPSMSPFNNGSIQIGLSKINVQTKTAKLSKTNGEKLQTHNLWDRNKSSFLPMDSIVKSELANTTWNLTGLAHKDSININII